MNIKKAQIILKNQLPEEGVKGLSMVGFPNERYSYHRRIEKAVDAYFNFVSEINKTISVELLEITIRTHRILNENNIKSLDDLLAISLKDLLKVKGCGKKTINELRDILSPFGKR